MLRVQVRGAPWVGLLREGVMSIYATCEKCGHRGPSDDGHDCMEAPAGLGGTVERECHGCVERDHEIERLRRVVDAVGDGMDDRLDALTRRVARMLAEDHGFRTTETREDYAERLYREAVSPEAVRE